MARTKETARKSNKGLPKATKGEQGRKGSGGGVGSGRSGGGSEMAVALAVVEAVAVALALAVVTEIETQKETFQVDVSVNNWKIDLQLQPLSGKRHTCGLSRK